MPPLRDALVRRVSDGTIDRLVMPSLSALREQHGLPAVERWSVLRGRPPLLLALTAEGFEYPRRDWPANVRLVGPIDWASRRLPPPPPPPPPPPAGGARPARARRPHRHRPACGRAAREPRIRGGGGPGGGRGRAGGDRSRSNLGGRMRRVGAPGNTTTHTHRASSAAGPRRPRGSRFRLCRTITQSLPRRRSMGFDQYHEPPEELPEETRTFARLCASLTEEAEAIGWYEQRLALEHDPEARAVMADAVGEEYKHFSMDFEFLLRRKPKWREIARGILFQA